jgi:hypothetical protein
MLKFLTTTLIDGRWVKGSLFLALNDLDRSRSDAASAACDRLFEAQMVGFELGDRRVIGNMVW